MNPRLPCGHFLGRVIRSEDVAGLVLTETRHPARMRMPWHTHENAYVCFVRRGSYTEAYGNRRRSCAPQTIAFHPSGELHAEQVHDADVHSFNIELCDRWRARAALCAGVMDDQVDFQGGRMAHLALRLYREFCQLDSVSTLAVEGLMLELLAEASRLAGDAVAAHPPGWLGQVREMLHARFRESLSLAEIAATVSTHPVYLACAFRRHCHCTIGDYVRRLRIDYAASRLAGSSAPLAAIALDAGFADQSHFSRTFKRITGLTPRAYREIAGQS